MSLTIMQSLHAKTKNKYQYSHKQIKINFFPRTPEQMAAFYEGRGFSKAMIKQLEQQCFITIGIRNKSQQIIWLDLSNWRFTSTNGKLQRLNRTYWKSLWKKMDIPLSHQSTFRWTLLPEELDFRPNEHEGGNITLPYSKTPFTLHARFETKADKSGQPIIIEIKNLECASNES
ncbi:hypothetical protein JYT31_02845 [Beggiatoa alba]|nr:hypothetical protein [Beggiatoa alba]